MAIQATETFTVTFTTTVTVTFNKENDVSKENAKELLDNFEISVDVTKPRNAGFRDSTNNPNSQYATIANLSAQIIHKPTGMSLIKSMRGQIRMTVNKGDENGGIMIVDYSNNRSFETEDGRRITLTGVEFGDELFSVLRFKSIQAYTDKGFTAVGADAQVAEVLGEDPEKVMDYTSRAMQKARQVASSEPVFQQTQSTPAQAQKPGQSMENDLEEGESGLPED